MMETENSPVAKETLEAPIAAVTVYSDRAQVVRKASVHLPIGARELVLENLPTNLDLDSLRARGSGEMAVKISAVESREVFLTEDNHQAAREVQRELDAVEAAGAAIRHQQEVLQQRLATINEMSANAAKSYARGLAQGNTSLQSAGELLDFLQAQSTQVHQSHADWKIKKRENAAAQIALQNRLKQLKGARKTKAHHVVVAVESSGEGQWNLEFSYVVAGASWKPLYDARVLLVQPNTPEAELGGKLSLSYLASITQNTGEDWNDAALSLSTARPSLGSLPPKLEPIYVDTDRSAVMRSSQVIASANMAGGSDEVEEVLNCVASIVESSVLMDRAITPIEAQIETAEIQSEGATVVFQLPRRMSVPSDGQPHRATIAQHDFSCKLDYLAVPRRSESAYLRATIKNESPLSLLPGQANIFRDEMFIGKTAMQPVAPNEEWKIFLGPEEQVKTRRELTRRDVEKNLMGNVRRQTFGHKIEIENLKSHRVALSIFDQIPVSKHEQIKVKLRHAEPEPNVDEMGILSWELNLAPHSKREAHFESVVESPREMNVVGIND